MADKTNMKEKVLNALEGGLQVTKVRRIDWDEGVAVYCEFMYNGRDGSFEFNFMGGDYGIENFKYDLKDDEDDSELWNDINEWVENNIEFKMSLKYKEEDIKNKRDDKWQIK